MLAHDSAMMEAGNKRSIEPGAKVSIKTGEKASPSNIVLALVWNEEAVMLRLYREIERMSDGFVAFELVPFNNAFRTIRIGRPEQARILGVAEKVYQEQHL